MRISTLLSNLEQLNGWMVGLGDRAFQRLYSGVQFAVEMVDDR